MDKDDANEALLESLVKESNVRVATLSEVPPDDISRLDEPVLEVARAPALNLMYLRQPVLQEILSDGLLVVRV